MIKGYLPWITLGAFLLLLSFFIYKKYSETDPTSDWNLRTQKMDELQKQLKAASEEVKKYQGTSECSRDDQCRVLGIGTPVCDLYKSFVIYSVVDAKEAELLQAIRVFNDVHRKMNDLGLTTGSCGVKPDRIRCVNRRCIPVRE